MESNSIPGGIYSNVQSGSMLGLEMSLHHPLQPQNPQNPHILQNPHHNLMNFTHPDENYHPQVPQSSKQTHPLSSKPKNQTLTLSDDDEPGFTAENSADDGRKTITSPWQRMKWTDNMVRLLIMVVFYIGDEVVTEAATDTNNSKKKGVGAAPAGGGVLQKKGKWKSVSKAMMERGFYVSPQQCEDKFNDLNKRYKRVNDILGKGISCRVVENQSLLDTMDHISPKMKEEVKKLLNSKHLFFREMCAYHNSCGHGVGGSAEHPPQAAAAVHPPQGCLHSENTSVAVPNLNRGESEGAKLPKGDADDDADADDEDDDHDDDDDDDCDDGDLNFLSRKRLKKAASPLIQQLGFELTSVLQDGTKSPTEKRRWLKMKLVRLDEERVGIRSQLFELEKQRLKWLKFSSKKEREMERERLSNERLRLENERMVLVVRQKELDLLDQQHSSNRKSDPSSVTG